MSWSLNTCSLSNAEFPVMAPSMWTRPQIKEFKEKMKQDPESVLTVGRGEVLTVRIPTNKDGTFFFWEFATDHYDIAFGLNFEWPDTRSENGDSGKKTEAEKSWVRFPGSGRDPGPFCIAELPDLIPPQI